MLLLSHDRNSKAVDFKHFMKQSEDLRFSNYSAKVFGNMCYVPGAEDTISEEELVQRTPRRP